MKQAEPFVEKALYLVLDFVTLYLFLFLSLRVLKKYHQRIFDSEMWTEK